MVNAQAGQYLAKLLHHARASNRVLVTDLENRTWQNSNK
jgi:hypothetical protein